MGIGNLPDGWTQTTLGEATKPMQKRVNPQDYPVLPYIGMENVEAHTMRLLGTVLSQEMKSAADTFSPGDVLYGRLRPYLNKVYLPEFEGLCSTEFIVFRKVPHIHSRYLQYFLNSWDFVKFANSLNAGDRPRVKFEQLSDYLFPLPPLPEQERIVAKIEELFTQLEAGTAALKRVRAGLKRYKASVLKAACEGQLFGDVELDNDGLPADWKWTKFKDAGKVQLGRQRAPKHHEGPHMRPYLRVANVFEDRLDLSDVKEMNFTPAEYEIYKLEYGDILLNEGQSPELLGRPAMYKGELPGGCFQNTLIRFQAYDFVDRQFALFVFRHYMHAGRFTNESQITTNIAHLSAGRFSEIEFPLPPLAEQQRIVAEVERRLSVAQEVESVVAASVARAGRLRQSVLKSAFEGRFT